MIMGWWGKKIFFLMFFIYANAFAYQYSVVGHLNGKLVEGFVCGGHRNIGLYGYVMAQNKELKFNGNWIGNGYIQGITYKNNLVYLRLNSNNLSSNKYRLFATSRLLVFFKEALNSVPRYVGFQGKMLYYKDLIYSWFVSNNEASDKLSGYIVVRDLVPLMVDNYSVLTGVCSHTYSETQLLHLLGLDFWWVDSKISSKSIKETIQKLSQSYEKLKR